MSSSLKITILMIICAAIGAVLYINSISSDNAPATEGSTPLIEIESQEATALQTAHTSESVKVIHADFSNPVIKLHNTSGVTIKAELLALDGNALTVRKDDGQTFTFGIGMLIDADQHYVVKHFEGRPQPNPQDNQPTTMEYIIPDSPEYLQSLFQELLNGAN